MTTIKQAPPEVSYLPTGQRHFGLVNWLGLWTLYKKEVQRFLKVGTQTVLAPVVSTLLFLVIFKVALGGARPDINGVPFTDFLAPGLIMMAIITNALANTSSSILMSKILGQSCRCPHAAVGTMGADDRLRHGRRDAGTFGRCCHRPHHVAVCALWSRASVGHRLLCACRLHSNVGGGRARRNMGGKFDHMAVITNFVVTPLVFLSGTFYSVRALPPFFLIFSRANPFFYLIDGFRYGVVDHSDGWIAGGAIALFVLTVLFGLACYVAFRSGWKLKT